MFTCHYCGIAFATDEAKVLHQKTHKPGRPCKFCEKKEWYLTETEKYIDKCITDKTIPYIEELAGIIFKVDDETILEWEKKKLQDTEDLEHPEFTATLKRLRIIQRAFLLKRTVGRYSPVGAIFQLKANHGLIETEKRILAGDKDEPMNVALNFIRDDN